MLVKHNTYEISLYNSEVRDLVKAGQSHKNFNDNWAEQRYIEIIATSEEYAYIKAERKYPKEKGFVYVSIIQIR